MPPELCQTHNGGCVMHTKSSVTCFTYKKVTYSPIHTMFRYGKKVWIVNHTKMGGKGIEGES